MTDRTIALEAVAKAARKMMSGPFTPYEAGIPQALAVLDATEPAGWRPIETAPRDGEDTLLLYKPDEPRSGEVMFAGYWNEELVFGTGWVPIAGAYRIERVTHWHSLPPPPAARDLGSVEPATRDS